MLAELILMNKLSREAALQDVLLRRVGVCSEDLTRRFDTDPRRARLLLKSGNPLAWEDTSIPENRGAPEAKSLLSSAVRAEIRTLLDWQKQVDEDTLLRRSDACHECPHRGKAPRDLYITWAEKSIDLMAMTFVVFVAALFPRRSDGLPKGALPNLIETAGCRVGVNL